MLDALRSAPARRRIAVLGEMRELGEWSERLHREIGREAASGGIDLLVAIRGDARHIIDEAVQAGMGLDSAWFFEDPAEAGEFLRGRAAEGDVVLMKGSRGTQVERALERFVQ
jgi:UDP-N-acetylmuramoyl-tripeptide--D-alanyl-D-alanine ligase